jgi:hypothetical protein
LEQELELWIADQNGGWRARRKRIKNASFGFQPRFKPDAASARLNQVSEVADSEVADSETELSSFEALIFAGSVMVPTMPTILPG